MGGKKWTAAKAQNPAAIYNEKRRIVFSELSRDPDEAKRWLDNYRKTLGPAGYAGLKAEVAFYERFRKEFRLTLAADVGDATDFAGTIDGAPHRIDVTTNADFKQLKSYEPLQLEGDLYKIAVFDGTDFELIDINYPFCPTCASGRILPTSVLLEENRDRQGNSLWSNDQLLVKICSDCGEVDVAERITTPFLTDFGTLYRDLNAANHDAIDANQPPIDVEAEVADYARRTGRYLSDVFSTRLVGVGSKDYEVTNPRDGDGYWTLKFTDQLPLVKDRLQSIYPWDLADG